ncbi:hypothetical protein AVEN_12801-1 [Araneus ventricosus]|uniref:Uncharacterized protein n=1 Tax=Araneus ventricosus TaxID=182803 RepID=A0A4Y2ACY7_ARAVE|nr:hypothetical protein AVEN_12801-1 [Araneus ventricosus]
MRPVSHNDELPLLKPPKNFAYDDPAVEMKIDEVETLPTSSDLNYVLDINEEPHLIAPEELYYLVRDLNLSNNTQNYLDQDCRVWNLLQKNTNISNFLNRHKKYSSFFPTKGGLYHCNDISGLISVLNFNNFITRNNGDCSSMARKPA